MRRCYRDITEPDNHMYLNQPDLPILIVGAGPAGLTAALELTRHGRAVRIIEARPQRTSHFKALSINTRTLELLEAVGVTERLLSQGRRVPAVHYRTLEGELFAIDYTRLAHRSSACPSCSWW